MVCMNILNNLEENKITGKKMLSWQMIYGKYKNFIENKINKNK